MSVALSQLCEDTEGRDVRQAVCWALPLDPQRQT